MSKIDYREGLFLKQVVDNINTKYLRSTSIMRFISLQEELEKGLEKVDKAKNKLFKDYKVESNEEGVFQWAGHKEEKEISKKFESIMGSNLKISEENLGFCEKEEVVESVKSFELAITQIKTLIKILAK